MSKFNQIILGAGAYVLGSSLAHADGLASLQMNGEKMEVKDGDILGLIINIGSGLAGFVFACLCVYSLYKTISDTWRSVSEYHSGRKDSLGEALAPLITNGGLTLVTFAVAVYTTSNFLTWMGAS